MNDILFTPIRLNELEILIEKSFERVLLKVNSNLQSLQPKHPQTTGDLIFLNEVCEITNLSKATIYKFIHEKKMPFKKPNGTKKLMFSRSEIMEWLQKDRLTK